MNNENPLVLLDGSSFVYRAYHVSRNRMTTRSGLPTGVTVVISSMLRKLISEYAGQQIVAVFDAHGKSFRHEMFADYKANRPPMPDDLRIQLSYVRRVVTALGLPLVSVPGVEADDVLGSYARAAEAAGRRVVICTGDKDLAQLVDARVTLYNTMTGVRLDAAGVEAKYGVPPEHIRDLLAIMGDTSDNIPGMKGAGDKTALALIRAFGGIEDIAARSSEIAGLTFRGAPKFAPKYLAALEDVRLSYRLATIRTDVPLPIPVADIRPPVTDREALLALCTELEMGALYRELTGRSLQADAHAPAPSAPEPASAPADAPAGTTLGTNPAPAAPLPGNQALPQAPEPAPKPQPGQPETFKTHGLKVNVVRDGQGLADLAARIAQVPLVALDTETTSLRPDSCALVGISLCLTEQEAFYIPLRHTGLGQGEQVPQSAVETLLLPALSRRDLRVVGHNLKFDLLVLHFAGLRLDIPFDDTMLMAHLLDSAQPAGLDPLALKYLNYKMISYEEVTGSGRNKLNFSDVPIDRAADYSGEDAEATFRLCAHLGRLLSQKPHLLRLYTEMEKPLASVLCRMEMTGVCIDPAVLHAQSAVFSEEIGSLTRQIFAAVGEPFNIASPKQLGHILFEKMQIPYPKKVPEKGSYSTAEEILQAIAPQYDVANLVLRHRELSKLMSTYTEKLPQMIAGKTGRLHGSFNQAGTVTGRLSSSDPNLQNIPARTPEGKRIRTAFIAPQGYTLISADYSQIELRLIAHIAGDEGLIRAFNAGHDIHRATAAEVLGKPFSEVTDAERSRAKATNFGLMYGMGAAGLRRQVGMSMQEARDYIDRYFSRYPRVREYMETIRQQAHQQGFVTTIYGREIALPNINASGQLLQKGAERAAINAPMQGSAADIIKVAMIRIQQWIDTLPPATVRMVLQVHDELLFEVRREFAQEAAERIREMMEHVTELKVPLTVGIGLADNWGDAH